MNYILLGAPGAGKGTQAKKIIEKFNMIHLSTGDMFREAKKSDPKIAKMLASGQLIEDGIVVKMVMDRINTLGTQRGFLLDGFPRTLTQARELDKNLDEHHIVLDGVLCINITSEEAVKRISGRRICSKCGASFHEIFIAPKIKGKCDACGADLIQRADDMEVVVKERLRVYEESTKPLIEYYSKKGLLLSVDGMVSEHQVFEQISEYIKQKSVK
jgi:adenylate kinase